MAGMGWKAWTREILTSLELQGFLQDQVVMRFASAAARDAKVQAPTEGMVCYLDDSNRVQFFDGTSWQHVGAGAWAYALDAAPEYGYSLTTGWATVTDASASVGVVPAGRTLEVEFSGPKLQVFTSASAQFRLAFTVGAATAYRDGAEVTNGSGSTNLTQPVRLAGSLDGAGAAVQVKIEARYVGGGGAALLGAGGAGPKLRFRVS